MTPVNLLPEEGEAYYFPQLFDKKLSESYFETLKNNVPWKQEPIKIFGKAVLQPRLTAFYGDPAVPYRYSGIEMKALPFTAVLLEIKSAAEKHAGVTFTHVLLNYYRDGNDSMGWHRDNEKSLGLNPVIGSVSFGAARKFQFRKYKENKTKVELELEGGSFLLMKGLTQHFWEHQVPKTSLSIGERINLTFRVLIN